MTVVLGSVRYLEREVHKGTHDSQFVRWVEHLRIAAERGAKLTRQLLAFSRQQKLEPQSVNVNQIVSGMSDLLRTTLGAGVSVDARLNFDLPPALADQTQLELVVINLCINGRDAMNGEGKLAITTELRTVETQPRIEGPAPGRYVVISVSDTGSGMSPQVLERAFEPFFTTKEVGKGSGLGLSQVLGFAKQSGGGVIIDTKLGHGTTVSVYLPLARQPIVFSDRTPVAPAAVALGAKRVLLVDDDATVREITAATVRELGCGVVEAASAGAALDIVASDEHIDVAVIDFAMPAELARRFRTSKPSLPIVFISGHADLSALADLTDCPVLRKPFADGELADCLQRTLSPQ